MTSSTPTQTLHAGAENPGGTIRHGEGFGLGGLASNHNVQQTARTMGEAERNVGDNASIEAGGPRPQRRPVRSVIEAGTRWSDTLAGRGGCL